MTEKSQKFLSIFSNIDLFRYCFSNYQVIEQYLLLVQIFSVAFDVNIASHIHP